MKLRLLSCRRGSSMIIALFALFLVFAFSVSLLGIATTALLSTKSDTARAKALAAAEAGVDLAISFLRDTAPDGTTDGSWRTYHPSSNPDVHGGDDWYTGTLATGETYRICVRSGTGVHTGKIIITSRGTATVGDRTSTRSLKVAVERYVENVSVWNNVIFGGVGQSGRSINGNVKIRGSVHLLGDGEDFIDIDMDGRWDDDEPYTDLNGNGQYDEGEPFIDVDGDGKRDSREPFNDINGNGVRDPALTVTDMASELSGTANIGNNYSSMSADLKAKLPLLSKVSFGGEMVDSLSAKLRVKHGKVNLSGTATVGDPNVTGNSHKETLDGSYVNDGWGGNQGSGNVFSDNGHSTGYDLGDGVVRFPVVSDPYTAPDGTSYASYMDYLRANALVIPGNLTLEKGTAYSASDAKGSISLDAAGNLTTSGIVYVEGDISIASKNNPIIYDGKGTLVSTNDIHVHGDVLPKTNFPRSDVLGLLARRNIELATGGGDAQLKMALCMYAQCKVVSSKQSEIAGTLVASYYQMTNVPSIFQVPELVDNLPPGMPGGDPIWVITIRVVSWQEVQ
jgi:hypothetical protein